ncbi:hypothetical protein ACI76O_08735 [Capnocytophaga cynodegmi]|uniref:hypothetical protein n=1 Tax=Capnocytophaga cynodegmi TaxID=28189 RepID=UPI0037CE1AEC
MKKIITILAIFVFFMGFSQQKEGKLTNIFSFVNAYDYQPDDELLKNNPEQIILVNEAMKLITRLEIKDDTDNYCFIKSLNTVDNTVSVYCFMTKENQWSIVNQDTSLISAIKLIMEVLTADLLFDFANNDESFYKEINTIKLQAKDERGILDIFKLAEVVQKNKIILSELK